MSNPIDNANATWSAAGTTKRRWIVAAIAFICGFLAGAVLL